MKVDMTKAATAMGMCRASLLSVGLAYAELEAAGFPREAGRVLKLWQRLGAVTDDVRKKAGSARG